MSLLWWGRRGVCGVCERRHCAHCNSFKLHFVQKSRYGPCPSRQLQQESPAHHLSLNFSFLPSPHVGQHYPRAVGTSSWGYPARTAHAVPHQGHREDISHSTNLLHHWWSPWGSGRVRAQMGLLSHSCSNIQQVTVSFQFWSFGSIPVCLSMCHVCREGVMLMFFRTTHFLALFFFTFHSIISPLIFLKAKLYSNGFSWLKTKCCRGDDSPHMCQWVSEFLCET